MSVNTELQNLLTKMGGSPLESDSNSDLIKKISNAYEGGGGSSGGCKCLIVNIVDLDLETEHLDVTAEELWEATQNGMVALRQNNIEESGHISFRAFKSASHTPAVGNNSYNFYFISGTNLTQYTSLTPTGYPTKVGGK